MGRAPAKKPKRSPNTVWEEAQIGKDHWEDPGSDGEITSLRIWLSLV